ncbi:hypothetical protein [Pelagicoccus mobilis]|uniref:Uncharacterized protein n=1 Tax=Pelagicoccus mobilis TaxID=415221 RepID=A0A934VQ09_9BACT|nr:hypothetical protein [Pelagicoccus mobilis]MBK1876083.1 hypothetical protein [Pelagicoccus mobilis]
MDDVNSSSEVYLGCSRGYLRLGRTWDAIVEVREHFKRCGYLDPAIEMMRECLIVRRDWHALVDFGHEALKNRGKKCSLGWACLILGLLRTEKRLLSLRAARSAQVQCSDDPLVRLESLRSLVASERLQEARIYFLESIAETPDLQSELARDPDFEEFLRAYAAGELGNSEPKERFLRGDGSNEIR